MKPHLPEWRRAWTLPLTIGLCDGILNALILASARLVRGPGAVGLVFALKVGCVAFATALFTIFVAEYAEERARLSRATRQLSLSQRGHLAATGLRHRVLRRAALAATIASVSSFVGATAPLVLAGTLAGAPWSGLLAAIVLLGFLGGILAQSFEAHWPLWTTALVVAGVAVSAIGTWLNIA